MVFMRGQISCEALGMGRKVMYCNISELEAIKGESLESLGGAERRKA